jgi:hypothetical protein
VKEMAAQNIIQLPYKISDAMPKEQLVLAVDRNFKEVERMLSILQLYMKQTGMAVIEDAGQVITHDEAGNVVIDPNKLADKMVGLNHTLQIAERAVGNLNLALDAVQPENMSAGAIKAAQPQWATHALNKDYVIINNSPLVGYIAWQNIKVTYKGEEYSIIDGNTYMRYAWWDFNYPTVMQTSNNIPELTNDDVLVFYNKLGIALTVPGATVFDGGLVVPGTITADALAVFSVLAKHIGAGEVLAEHIKAGEITTELIAAEGLLANIIRGGTLTLGGYGNVNGLLSLLNAAGNEVVRADNTGITISVGSVGGNDVADLETQAGAQAKAEAEASESLVAAKTYAEDKAAEAQAAAEAVASAEALVAQANAEAYADGIVDAEEQARINQATANLASAKTYAETKATEAEAASKAYADAIEVGGRNLLLESGVEVTNAVYGMAEYYFSEPPIEGETYTLTLKGALGADRNDFYAYNSGGYINFGKLIPNADNTIFSKTFTWKITSGDNVASNTYLQIYQNPNTGTSESTIKWIKLEKGNKATDWTPAPEDAPISLYELDPDAQGILDSHNESISIIETDFVQLADNIETRVSQTDYDEFGNLINQQISAVEQTQDDMSIELSQMNENITNIDGDVTEIKTGINFDENGMHIGKSDSPLQMNLSNEQLEFIDNGQLVAYVNGQKLYITMAEILESLVVGNHKIEKYDENITLVRWVG